jgi:hypothetical protein
MTITKDKMKKIILSLAVASALTSTLSAQKTLQKSIGIGTSSTEIMNESGISYSLSYSFKATTYNNFVWGSGFFAEHADINDIEMFGLGAELIAGYQFTDNLSTYAILGAKRQTLNDSINSLGIGYGIAAQYDIAKYFAIETRYMNYDMIIDPIGEYTNPNIKVNFKITWE